MTAAPDPVAAARRLLGVDSAADAAAVRAARRRLAKGVHPDAGGDAAAMGGVNDAVDVLLGALAAGSGADRPATGAEAGQAQPRPAAAGPQAPAAGMRIDHDVASFIVEALPVEAFEALLVVTSWIGEVIVDEPPYQLDVMLTDPLRCWCRLDLVPDAGASTVAVTIGALPDEQLPEIDAVRDLWVGCLNQLGADEVVVDGR